MLVSFDLHASSPFRSMNPAWLTNPVVSVSRGPLKFGPIALLAGARPRERDHVPRREVADRGGRAGGRLLGAPGGARGGADVPGRELADGWCRAGARLLEAPGRALPCLGGRARPLGAHFGSGKSIISASFRDPFRTWLRMSLSRSLYARAYPVDRSGAESVTEEGPRVTSGAPHRSTW